MDKHTIERRIKIQPVALCYGKRRLAHLWSTIRLERRFDLMQILTCLLFNTALTIQVEDSSDTKRQYYRIWILASFIRISVSCFVCLFVFFSWLILQWSLTQGMPLLASFINYCQCCASLCLLILQMLIFFFFFYFILSYTRVLSVQVPQWFWSTQGLWQVFEIWQEMWQGSNRRLVPFLWRGWNCHGFELCPHSQMQYRLNGMDGRKPSDSWRRSR